MGAAVTTARVTLIADEGNSALTQLDRGRIDVSPSQAFPDPADEMLIGTAPRRLAFTGQGFPQDDFVPCDLAGPQQEDGTPGWSYRAVYSGVPGYPDGFSRTFYLLSSAGPVQRLSELVQVPAAQPGQQYVPWPQVPPAAGQVFAWEGGRVAAVDPGSGPQGPAGATGATGPQGPAGSQGSAGAEGDAGAQGATGAQGIAGAAGATGPKGDTGSTGVQGPSGPAGGAGTAGAKGDTGAAGTQGAAGPQGPAGPTGPQGPAGDPATNLVTSVNGKTGAVTLGYSDTGADQAGTAAAVQGASLQKSANLSDLASAGTARSSLGLGTAATQASSAFDAAGAASGAASGITAKIGAPSGIASLDSSGRVPASQASPAFLAANQYAPATQALVTATSSTLTALSGASITTGAFTAPASGTVVVTASFVGQYSTTSNGVVFGLLGHGTSTLYGTLFAYSVYATGIRYPASFSFLVTGLSGGTAYALDLAAAVNSGTTYTIYAIGSTTPGFTGASAGAPVLMTVQAA